MEQQRLKRKFRRLKMRIQNGHEKAGDKERFAKMSKQLGYKNYYKEIAGV